MRLCVCANVNVCRWIFFVVVGTFTCRKLRQLSAAAAATTAITHKTLGQYLKKSFTLPNNSVVCLSRYWNQQHPIIYKKKKKFIATHLFCLLVFAIWRLCFVVNLLFPSIFADSNGAQIQRYTQKTHEGYSFFLVNRDGDNNKDNKCLCVFSVKIFRNCLLHSINLCF